jgi:hypothetical protein
MIIGEKGRSQLSRAFGPSCDRACTEVSYYIHSTVCIYYVLISVHEAYEVVLRYMLVRYNKRLNEIGYDLHV